MKKLDICKVCKRPTFINPENEDVSDWIEMDGETWRAECYDGWPDQKEKEDSA
jgi:hypothetical protein